VRLDVYHHFPEKRRRIGYALLVFGPIQEQDIPWPTFEVSMIQLQETQRVPYDIVFKTKKGNPATVEPGSVRVTVTDEAVAVLEPNPANELKGFLVAKAPGAAQMHATADADLGDGVKTVTLTADIAVTAGEAVGGEIVFGPPEEQPE
jgi:hypothetical protein